MRCFVLFGLQYIYQWLDPNQTRSLSVHRSPLILSIRQYPPIQPAIELPPRDKNDDLWKDSAVEGLLDSSPW